ncbi:MAG: thiolase family protein [Pseudomonadales bacterium]|nr:thiolase family protein [Pseudomonadales bacterium]
MGKRAAAIVALSEWAPQRRWDTPMFSMEASAQLAAETLADGEFEKDEIDGLVMSPIPESPMFGPSALAEYLGVQSNFNEVVDLGGATPAGMIWRAAAAIEVGICENVLVLCPSVPAPRRVQSAGAAPRGRARLSAYLGGDSWGSPQGQFEIPYGLVAATPSFAMIASRYCELYGVEPETLAKIAVQQRYNALANPKAINRDKPITIDDVMNSRMIADPLKLLELVMPCFGGSAVLVTSAERAKRAPHRPVFLSGYGEHLTHKSVTYMPDFIDTPIRMAADRAFKMSGASREAIDMASIYDCYTITVLLTIEDAGFCKKGQGGAFIEEHDLRYHGDWPLNTHGGQLGMGQAGLSGGMSHVTEAVLQLQGRADGRQVKKADLAYVNGTGGMMAEQVALILEGA